MKYQRIIMLRIVSKFIFLLTTFLLSQSLVADIYKWKDKDGKTHFSEKKPEGSEKIESIEISSSQKFNNIQTNLAIKKAKNSSVRHLVAVRPDTFWFMSKPEKKTTSYYFGGDCVSPQTVSFQEMQDNHRYLLPRMDKVIDYIVQPISRLDYPVTSSMKQPLLRNLARFEEPLVLRFKLQDLIYQLCVTNLSKQYRNHRKTQSGTNPFDFSEGEYRHRRARITLGWILEDAESGKILFEGNTSGSANYWDRDINIYKLDTIKKAIEYATINLFANQEFVALLTAKKGIRTSKKTIIQNNKERGFFDNVQDVFASNAIRKSKFAKVISQASSLKILAMEYYQIKGVWPTSLSDINTARVDLFDENYVSKVQFDYDGAIVITLDSKNFEEGAMISLQPKSSYRGGRVDWLCITNLNDNHHGNYCQTIE